MPNAEPILASRSALQKLVRRRPRLHILCVATAMMVATVCVFSNAATADGPKISDPSKVDDDYKFQGEYVGEVDTGAGPQKFGVQIIALGNGEFTSVAYSGGLPGEGWDLSEKLTPENTGKRDGDRVVFEGEVTAVVQDGNILVNDANGQPLATFSKTTRQSHTLGAEAPEGATVLFDGSSVEGWKNGKMTDDGLLMEGTTSEATFGSHKLHIEFRLPYQPQDRGQGRGNSGIYVQGRYEVQMLDSFGLEGKQNECGGLYSVKDPDVNMCLPPLVWQTYDIEYHQAKHDDDGNIVENPRITVLHNGVKIHDNVELPGERSTTAAPVKPGDGEGPVYLQDHGCPVRYRNIWVQPIED